MSGNQSLPQMAANAQSPPQDQHLVQHLYQQPSVAPGSAIAPQFDFMAAQPTQAHFASAVLPQPAAAGLQPAAGPTAAALPADVTGAHQDIFTQALQSAGIDTWAADHMQQQGAPIAPAAPPHLAAVHFQAATQPTQLTQPTPASTKSKKKRILQRLLHRRRNGASAPAKANEAK